MSVRHLTALPSESSHHPCSSLEIRLAFLGEDVGDGEAESGGGEGDGVGGTMYRNGVSFFFLTLLWVGGGDGGRELLVTTTAVLGVDDVAPPAPPPAAAAGLELVDSFFICFLDADVPPEAPLFTDIIEAIGDLGVFSSSVGVEGPTFVPGGGVVDMISNYALD